MAEQVAVSGFNLPGTPSGAIVTERQAPAPAAAPAGFPAIPPAAQQAPGWVQQTQAAAVGDADYQAFLAFKASQGAAPAPAAVAPVQAAPAAKPAPMSSYVDPGSAIAQVQAAAATDPIINSLMGGFMALGEGVDVGRAYGKALSYADPSLVDVAYLKEVGGVNADRLIALAKGTVEHVIARTGQIESSIYESAGGRAQWDAAAAAFNATAPIHLKQAIGVMLKSGNAETITAGAQNVIEFAKASGMVVTPPTGHVNAGGGAPSGVQGLSKAAFQAELQKLNTSSPTYGNDRGELMGRRAIGKSLGI